MNSISPYSSVNTLKAGRSKTKGPLEKNKRGKTVKGNLRTARTHRNWSFRPKLENEAVVLNSILPDYTIEYYSICVNDIRNLITSLVQNNGFTKGPDKYNIIKNYTIQLIEGKEPANPEWMSTSSVYKIPSKLGLKTVELIVDFLRCTDRAKLPKYYQVVITLLNIIRMIDGLSEPCYGSIVEKSKPIDEVLLKDFETYVSERLKSYKWDNNQNVNLFRYRFNLKKNGPNGKPKIETSKEEAVSLIRGKLHYPFKRVCEEMGISYLYTYLLALVEKFEASNTSSELIDLFAETKLRKLVSIPDSGCKTRVVAICDFWTQLCMEPVRDHVQFVTERLYGKTDFRKDQDQGVALMKEFQLRCIEEEVINGHKLDIRSLRFYDISSWTDRFHRDLQKITMRHLFSSKLAESWAQLVVHCDWYVPSLDSTIKYGQGQGMGTNGSFDIATLTDHLFINFIYDEHSSIKGIFNKNTCYGKVGDDLWIYDPDQAIGDFYGKINLPINANKSKEYGTLGSIAEFCSRTFLNGIDSSRISPKIINKSKDFRYIPMLLSLAASRGIQLEQSSFQSIQRTLKGSEETYFDKLQDWIISYLVLGSERGSVFEHLTYDYLMEGQWLTDKTVKVLSEPTNLIRLTIAHSIMSILESDRKIKILMSETLQAKGDLDYDEIKSIKDSNLFNLNDPGQEAAKRFCCVEDLLEPKQIVVLGRWIDQSRLTSEELLKASELEGDSYEDILTYARSLSKIASRSCYDQGILQYDTKKVFNTQFKIVRTIESLSQDFTVLRLASSEDRDLINSMVTSDYDELPVEWIRDYLPTLDVDLNHAKAPL